MFSFEHIKKFLRIIILVIRQLGLALLSFSLLLGISGALFEGLKEIDLEMAVTLAMSGPSSVESWIALGVIFFAPALILALLIAHDARKFEKHGVKTRWFWWGLVSLPPFIFVGLPVYFLVREFAWVKKVGDLVEKDALARQSDLEKNINKVIKRGWFLNGILVIFLIYVVAVSVDIPGRLSKGKTEEIVAKIHATKLTMDDVMGVNLPPNPGVEADKTVQGVDANTNGIRDDVELAIFEKYPDSAKTRAVLLQYALALQMILGQQFVNIDTVVASVQEEDRAYMCVGNILDRGDMTLYLKNVEELRDFVFNRQINTYEREKSRNIFYEKLGSYESLGKSCDLDLVNLPS